MALTGVSGLASGIDSTAIITALLGVDGAAETVQKNQQTKVQSHLDALRSFNTKMLSASLDLAALKDPSTWQNSSATSSNPAALSASVTAGVAATAGTYTFSVTSLAQAHQLAAAGQTSETSSLVAGAGSLTLQVGNGASTTLNFTASNGSLDSIAQSINSASLGITASVINDGSSGGSPYRLVLKSNQTGTANAITVNGGGDLANLFGAGSQTLTTATDAQLTFGSTLGGGTPLTLTSSSNSFSNVIPGVTLTASSLASNLTVTVGTDTTAAKSAITTFVNDLNTAITYYDQNSTYNATTNVAGPLFTDSTARNSLFSLTSTLTGVIGGLPQSMNNISALGITSSETDGTFSIDANALGAALSSNPKAVANLFTNTGTSSDPGIAFGGLSSKTGVSSPFTVAITQASTQAVAGTTGPLAASTVIAANDNALALTVDGQQLLVHLTAGTYTQAQLAAHVGQVINAAITAPGSKVTAGLNGSNLDLRSTGYGSNHSIMVSSGTVATQLGLSTGLPFTGQDVRGTINGINATGTGQFLVGAAGTSAEGLSLVVTANAPIASASVTAQKGLAQLLHDNTDSMVNATTGSLSNEEDSLQTTLTNIGDQIAKTDAWLAQRKAAYQSQFLAMETAIQKLQSQGNFITGFINSLNGTSSSSSSSSSKSSSGG